MSLGLVAILVASAVALSIFEVWGRRPHVAPLVSREALYDTLSLLNSRGVHGTALEIRLPDSGFDVVVTKEINTPRRPAYTVTLVRSDSASWKREAATSPAEVRSSRTAEVRALTTKFGSPMASDLDGVVRHLEEAATAAGSRLFPGAIARFRGSVLAINIPRLTGVES